MSTILSDDGAAGFSSRGAAAVRALQPSLLLAADARIDNDEDPASAYERWGRHWHRHLWGAFAAAVWNRQTGELLLLRDRTGERGLYWCRTAGGGVMFASEPAQLAASGQVGDEPNLLRLLAYLLDAPAAPTWTYFERVHRVPEGHQVRLTADRVETDCYWDWSTIQTEPRDRRTAAPELARRLQEAVDRRLPEDGETGVLLSGGLDSMSVAAQAAGALERRGRQLHAFTWTSRSGSGIDETPASRLFIQSRPNVIEHAVEADLIEPLSRYPEAYADPSSPETNAFPDLLLATLETARQKGVKVLMNGIGGDSVAGWLAPELALLLRGDLLSLARRWRGTGRLGLLREIRRMASGSPPWPDWLTPRGERMAREAGLDRSGAVRKALTSRDRFRRFALAAPSNAATLERFDRWSRRLGVRIAAPWHDADLAALVLGLPDRALDVLPPGKSLIREAMQGALPVPAASTPGSGMRQTLKARGLVEQILSQSRLAEMGLVDASRLLATYREKGTAFRILEVLTAEGWLRARKT